MPEVRVSAGPGARAGFRLRAWVRSVVRGVVRREM